MSARTLVLQHVPFEGPGNLADLLAAAGRSVRVVRAWADEIPASPEEAEAQEVVVMGGPMNIYQDRLYPWLKRERAFLQAWVESGRPALGICLGAQFLADALGGRVHQNPEVEIGWFQAYFTAESRAWIASLPESLEVLHWHGDTFELPRGARRLAWSPACVNQGFLWEHASGGRVAGLQFHLEMDRPAVDAIVTACGDELRAEGCWIQSADNVLETAETAAGPCRQALAAILAWTFRIPAPKARPEAMASS